MYRSCAPFSGPRGDYADAARKEVYGEAQHALYTRYKKFHGPKLQTVLLLNGLSLFLVVYPAGGPMQKYCGRVVSTITYSSYNKECLRLLRELQ